MEVLLKLKNRLARSCRGPSIWPGAVFALVISVWLPALHAQSAAPASDQLMQIDDQMQNTLDVFYRQWLQKSPPAASDETMMAKLSAFNPADALQAGLWLRANLDLLHRKADDKLYAEALALLYELNDTATVRKITDFLNKEGTPAARARNNLLLANYYYERQNWPGVRSALQRLNGAQLPADQRVYLALLHGYALQADKEHRKAVDFYRQVTPDSPYFPYAKLNEGTAYLRQGWWSEAFYEFEQAIKTLPEDSELRNRLLVTLGFSQIHHEFYRHARATLRRVSLSSSYAPKAIMGLGLSAAHQKDLPAALNLFLRLTASREVNASVDEAHLLVAHVYEESGQTKLAAEAYEKAIDFYENRLAELAQAENSLNAAETQLMPLLTKLDKQAERLYVAGPPAPDYMFDNYRRLQAMQSIAEANKLKVPLAQLTRQTEHALRNLSLGAIEMRRSLLQSYSSQAKYRLATLYDKP